MIGEGAILRAVKLDVADIHGGFPLDMVGPEYFVNQLCCRGGSVGDAGYARGERCCDDHGGTAIVVMNLHLVAGSGLAGLLPVCPRTVASDGESVYAEFGALHV